MPLLPPPPCLLTDGVCGHCRVVPGWDVGGRETMKKRLLHNGANTMQIIDVYISTIKVRAQLMRP